jgi:hypothetical protein
VTSCCGLLSLHVVQSGPVYFVAVCCLHVQVASVSRSVTAAPRPASSDTRHRRENLKSSHPSSAWSCEQCCYEVAHFSRASVRPSASSSTETYQPCAVNFVKKAKTPDVTVEMGLGCCTVSTDGWLSTFRWCVVPSS